MLSICKTYWDLRDLTIGKRNVFIRWFGEPSETQPANRLSLDGTSHKLFIKNISSERTHKKIIEYKYIHTYIRTHKQHKTA